MQKSKFASCFLAMLVLICLVSNTAYASSENVFNDSIDAEHVQSIITRIEASEMVYDVDIGNGLAVRYAKDKASLMRATASDSYSGYYYRTDNNEKVAVFSFSASFSYTGSSVTYSTSSADCSAVKDDWSISYSRSHDNSQTVLSTASCVFTLYYNGNYNNTNTVTISCTKNGVTSVVSN